MIIGIKKSYIGREKYNPANCPPFTAIAKGGATHGWSGEEGDPQNPWQGFGNPQILKPPPEPRLLEEGRISGTRKTQEYLPQGPGSAK